jgi:hypothetical protein
MTDQIRPETYESENKITKESPELKPRVEAGRETESERIQGAQMLETPADGSFVHALQTFVAWVTDLLADKDKK